MTVSLRVVRIWREYIRLNEIISKSSLLDQPPSEHLVQEVVALEAKRTKSFENLKLMVKHHTVNKH